MKHYQNIIIGPIKYEILLVEDGDKEVYTELTEGETHYFGRVAHRTQKIYIDGEIPGDHQVETIIHEIVHALSAFYVLDLDERQTTGLGIGLTLVLRDNKWLKELYGA